MSYNYIPTIKEIQKKGKSDGSNICITGGEDPIPCTTGSIVPPTNQCLTGKGEINPNLCMAGSGE